MSVCLFVFNPSIYVSLSFFFSHKKKSVPGSFLHERPTIRLHITVKEKKQHCSILKISPS